MGQFVDTLIRTGIYDSELEDALARSSLKMNKSRNGLYFAFNKEGPYFLSIQHQKDRIVCPQIYNTRLIAVSFDEKLTKSAANQFERQTGILLHDEMSEEDAQISYLMGEFFPILVRNPEATMVALNFLAHIR